MSHQSTGCRKAPSAIPENTQENSSSGPVTGADIDPGYDLSAFVKAHNMQLTVTPHRYARCGARPYGSETDPDGTERPYWTKVP